MDHDGAVYNGDFCLDNGLVGEALTIPSANPKNFYQAISDTAAMPRLDLWAKLFVPDGDGPFPVVIVVPGSLGLQSHHLAHASTIADAGIAACAIDPFGPRNVVSTVDNQIQYSFAASAWDVLATAELLATRPEIDASRIGAQGHSRGGSAVLSAASVHLAAASDAPKLAGVYAAYPWCGHQFLNPAVGGTRVRAIIGDLDDWCSPTQVQAHIHAIRVAGGDASVRIVPNAHHSFDRTTPLEHEPDAAVAPNAPTVYIADNGAFILPTSDVPDPALVDLDGFLYAAKAGFGVRGAHIAGTPDLAPLFAEDMMTFWTSIMTPSTP
ncbi:MAG: dienelactone hydrolase family protein [bacterium]|nr:dienelactone hydrolase family protein [bacterium]